MVRAWAMVIFALMLIGQVCFAQVKVAPRQAVETLPAQRSPQNTADSSQGSACGEQMPLSGGTAQSTPIKRAARLHDELAARARAGDAAAAWRAALASYRGECRAANFSEMARYMQLAHQADHACASGALGLMHAKGWGVTRDLSQARALLERSIQAGCARAYFWGWLADEAVANPQARERARTSLEDGASRNEGHALNALAVLNEVDGQRGAARHLYLRAASAGNATARLNLARLTRYFSQTTEKPSAAALKKRAEGGEAQAQYLLARQLHQGDGISPDYAQSLKWYGLAAAAGHPAAREMFQLVQARLGVVALAKAQAINLAMMSDLAFVDLANDESNKRRGITQPIEDTDPFAQL